MILHTQYNVCPTRYILFRSFKKLLTKDFQLKFDSNCLRGTKVNGSNSILTLNSVIFKKNCKINLKLQKNKIKDKRY